MSTKLILYVVFLIILLQVSTYLLSFVQTIRNILSFAFLALCISFGLGLTYNIQYYPVFLLLTYVGAILVATLFVVLTFDIRYEYKQKLTYVEHFWPIMVLTNALDAFFCYSWTILRRVNPYSSEIGPSSISADELKSAFEKCAAKHPDLVETCRNQFITSRDRSLYNNLLDYTNDLHVVSSNFYTNYSFLFICLSIVLSIALMAALAILKHR